LLTASNANRNKKWTYCSDFTATIVTRTRHNVPLYCYCPFCCEFLDSFSSDIYLFIIKPIWTYGIEICGCASKSSQAILQKAQSKILRMITNAPWYVSNLTLHADLKIPYVREIITEKYVKHHQKL
jgi:hypothetical protein